MAQHFMITQWIRWCALMVMLTLSPSISTCTWSPRFAQLEWLVSNAPLHLSSHSFSSSRWSTQGYPGHHSNKDVANPLSFAHRRKPSSLALSTGPWLVWHHFIISWLHCRQAGSLTYAQWIPCAFSHPSQASSFYMDYFLSPERHFFGLPLVSSS